MPAKKNLTLEEKLKIPILKLPLSRPVKNELYYKGVYTLKQLVDKYHCAPGRVCLPGFKDRVFAEAGYLLVAMGLDYGDKDKGEYNILDVLRSKLDRYVSKKNRKRIDKYVSEKV